MHEHGLHFVHQPLEVDVQGVFFIEEIYTIKYARKKCI